MNIDEVNGFFSKKTFKIKFDISTDSLYSTIIEEWNFE